MSGETFLTIGYRYGWIGAPLFLYAGQSKGSALNAAEAEVSRSGGKYGCAVYQFMDDDQELIHYSPSGRREKRPEVCERDELARAVGREVLEQLESGSRNWPKILEAFESEKQTQRILREARGDG